MVAFLISAAKELHDLSISEQDLKRRLLSEPDAQDDHSSVWHAEEAVSDMQVILRHLAAMNKVAWGRPKLKVRSAAFEQMTRADANRQLPSAPPLPTPLSEDATSKSNELLDDPGQGHKENVPKQHQPSATVDLLSDDDQSSHFSPPDFVATIPSTTAADLLSDDDQSSYPSPVIPDQTPAATDLLSDDDLPGHNDHYDPVIDLLSDHEPSLNTPVEPFDGPLSDGILSDDGLGSFAMRKENRNQWNDDMLMNF